MGALAEAAFFCTSAFPVLRLETQEVDVTMLKAIYGSFLMVAALSAHSDYVLQPVHDNDDRYRSGSSYRTSDPVSRTIRDLQVIFSRAYVDRHEADHFRRAIDDLAAFRERAVRGHFDRGRLNRALENMDHLAGARQLHPRDRTWVRQMMYELQRIDGRSYGRW